MTRYVAFLRAINVGGRFVKMNKLRHAFTEMGFAGVDTYIQSGNVVFTAPAGDTAALERKIEEGLQAALGFAVPTLIRTAAEVVAIANDDPFPEEEMGAKSALYVSFLRDKPDAAAQAELVALSSEIDVFHVQGRQAFWLRHRHRGESKLTNATLERILDTQATRRNANTVRRIVKKYFADGA